MIKILIDMNLPPSWVQFLSAQSIEAIHWTTIGKNNAPDIEILGWAKENGYIVFTHDLDFSAILAATNADGPSVLQVRTQNVMPGAIGDIVLNAIRSYENDLRDGALLSINLQRSRIRILPLRRF